jgi:two-component system, NarL family, response regulator NreC
MDPIRILIVEDHELVRDGIASLVDRTAGMKVVGTVSSIRDALPVLDLENPDVVLADLALDDGNGMEVARAIRRGRQKGRVIILTGMGDSFAAAEAIADGAAGYLLKTQGSADVLEAIRTVAAGGQYVAPEIAAKLATNPSAAPQPRADDRIGLGALSRREHEVFRQVLAGHRSKEIARRLCISVKTVESHRTSMNRKLAVKTTADLIRFAMTHGIPVAPHGVSPES